jgi:catalase
MLFVTRMFGVTGSDAERDLAAERACIEEIVEKVLLLQSKSASEQHRPVGRGTHVKGTSARAQFEVFDVSAGRDPELAKRLAKGIFATPGIYPAVVRFGNADPKVNSDFKADVRSLSFSVDLTKDGKAATDGNVARQDFSLQNTTTLPINDASAFLAIMKLLTASNPAAGLWSLPFKDKLRVMRTLTLVQVQAHQKIKPYQHLRYGSNVPFRHGPVDIVKYSATPFPDNPARVLQRSNPNALQDEMARHLKEDGRMSGFEFGVQFLDAARMTYWGKHLAPNFWTENASIDWPEAEAPFHPVGRLTLVANSQLTLDAADAVYFDVTKNSTPDSMPVGSINRARQQGEEASRKARARAENSRELSAAASATH